MPRYDLAGNPLPDDPETMPVRYDLAGNPISPPPGAPPVQRPPHAGPVPLYGRQIPYPDSTASGGSHVGTSADHLVGARSSADLAQRILENSSGALDDVPPEVERLRWNWGGFLLPSFWAFNHGMKPLAFVIWGVGVVLHFCAQVESPLWDGIGIGYTVFCLGVSLWLGLCGNRIAWRIRRFEGGIDEFFDVQKAWLIAGVAVAIVSVLLGGKLTPGIALYSWKNVIRPVNSVKTDYAVFYGSTPVK